MTNLFSLIKLKPLMYADSTLMMLRLNNKPLNFLTLVI